ncbi:MAG: response regulator [Oligoflexales bacterium]|nr:response regulator [Oligoflexales bacterium]
MKKVLIVDDSPTIRQQAAFILSREGYEVIEATDGVEGLDTIKKNTDLSLVISDINMPNMNGLEMLGKVRELNDLNHIPIFMLTTESDPKKIEDAKTKGANGRMVEPFEPKILVEILSKFAT